MTAEATQPTAAPWRAEQLRLTIFPDEGRPASLARDWWNAITGTPPEKITEEPRTGTVQLQGQFEGSPLLMHADEGRLDIRQLLVKPQTSPAALPRCLQKCSHHSRIWPCNGSTWVPVRRSRD